jgi:hypothetical protein
VAEAAEAAAEDAAGATAEDRPEAPALVEARAQALLIAPVRLGLALAAFVLVRVRGVEAGVAGSIFAFGAGLLVFAVLASARRRRTWARIAEAGTAPANARVEPRRRSLPAATYPSTIGLTGLTGIALVANTRLRRFSPASSPG